jgi:hypothetical protein
MRLINALMVIGLALFVNGVSAAGRVSVHGYTKANGTQVAPYTRAAPGSKGQGSYTRSGGAGLPSSAIDDDPNWSAGLGGPRAHADSKTGGCVYGDVMTDEQIAACRKH